MGKAFVVPDSKRERRRCILGMIFWVVAVLAVLVALALVGALYILVRRWL